MKGSYPNVAATLRGKSYEELAISAITEAELRYWIKHRPNESRVRLLVDEFLSRVPSLPWDSAVTHTYAQLRSDSRQLGKTLAELDLLIAAHALALDATLVTHDRAFTHISNLRTEDWV